MFKNISLLVWVGLLSPILFGAEIETSQRSGLVKKHSDELVRQRLVGAFGDLNRFMFLWVHPDPVMHAAALLHEEGSGQEGYTVLYWRWPLRKEQVNSSNLSADDADKLLQSIDRIQKAAVCPKVEKDDLIYPDRVFLYRRFKNVDVVDWHSVSVRSNSRNRDFGVIRDLMIPVNERITNEADLSEFFNPKQQGNGSGKSD